LQFMHRDIVFYYPPGVEELGSNAVCKVQGMYIPKRVITVQGHPEFSEEIMTEILESRHRMGIFDDETYNSALKRVVKPHDGLVVSKAFLRFLLDE
jgi:GMP synthase-like glutamine amidotransferase